MGCGQSHTEEEKCTVPQEPISFSAETGSNDHNAPSEPPDKLENSADKNCNHIQTDAQIDSTQTAKMGSAADTVTLIHFNDVYNIEPREQDPVGGASRFIQAIRDRHNLNPMVLFSGDVFAPSLMSTVTKGKQMVPILNAMNIQCACYGNHDFDFGVDILVKLASQCNFPWLISNVYDNLTDKPLAEGIVSHTVEWQGKKFGFVGLVEMEWIATLATLDADDITFISYVDEGRRLARQLRQEGADYVIALTHMRWPNDIKLAEQVEEIDLILGGHDHDYNIQQVNGKWIIKSGTDFREFSAITLRFNAGKVDVDIEKVVIDSSVAEEPESKAVVQQYMEIMGEKMESTLGHMEVELEGRFAKIRTEETNLGNFVTDIMLQATDAEIAILNSGTLRSDTVHPKGVFKVKDLLSILPMIDPLGVLRITGAQLIKALENGVSQYPALEGRFPQVAGVTFAFDPSKPAGQRVDPRFIKVQDEYLKLEKDYRLVTKHYLTEGRDGYDIFKDCEILVGEEEGPRLTTIVQNHFTSVKVVRGDKHPKFQHRQSIIPVTRRKSLVKQMSFQDEGALSPPMLLSPTGQATELSPTGSTASIGSEQRSRAMLQRRASIQSVEVENMPTLLSPHIEGRIICLDEEKRRMLEEKLMSETLRDTTITEAGESEPNTPLPASDMTPMF